MYTLTFTVIITVHVLHCSNRSCTFPFENRKNVYRFTISPNGVLMITIDEGTSTHLQCDYTHSCIVQVHVCICNSSYGGWLVGILNVVEPLWLPLACISWGWEGNQLSSWIWPQLHVISLQRQHKASQHTIYDIVVIFLLIILIILHLNCCVYTYSRW